MKFFLCYGPHFGHPIIVPQLRLVDATSLITVEPSIQVLFRNLAPILNWDDRQTLEQTIQRRRLNKNNIAASKRFPGTMTVQSVSNRRQHKCVLAPLRPQILSWKR